MFLWLRKNIGTFLLSLILAVGVWVAAVNASDPDEEAVYPAPIPLEVVGQDTALLITNTPSEQIELTLRAPRSIWNQLNADPDHIHAILDLSGLKAGSHTIAPQIQIDLQPSKITLVSPDSVDVLLENLVVESFPIQLSLDVQPAVGYQAGSPQLSAYTVEISGAQSLVEKIDAVQALYAAQEANEEITANLSLKAVDADGQAVTGVSLAPSEIRLTLPMSQQGGYRDVAVKVVVTGQVANLYRLTNISVFPPVVTLYSSDNELVSELSGTIETEPLDIDGISEDISVRLKLNLPENVLPVGEQSVLVEASVEPVLGSLTLSEQAIEIINLDPALWAELSSPTVDVIISGPLIVLDELGEEELRVVVDAAGLTLGEHQLNPTVETLNPKLQVQSILPESIKITVQEMPLATPTALP